MKRYVLIKEQLAAVRHPEADAMVVPGWDEDYTEDHPLVRAYPHMFREEGTEPARREAPDSVPIERGTQAPGETRPPTVVIPRKAGRPRTNPKGVRPDGWGE